MSGKIITRVRERAARAEENRQRIAREAKEAWLENRGELDGIFWAVSGGIVVVFCSLIFVLNRLS